MHPILPALIPALGYLDEAGLALAAFLLVVAFALGTARKLPRWGLWALLALIPFRFAFALFFVATSPDLVTSTDGKRYLLEIEEIAREPLAWNPLEGTGPGYRGSAKIGMSWLCGALAHLTGAEPLFVALLVAVTASCLTVFLTARLATFLYPDPACTVATAFFVALHPQSLYWSGKLTRESLAMLLVAALFLVGLELLERWSWIGLVSALALAVALAATRAQLGLFGPFLFLAVAGGLLLRKPRHAVWAGGAVLLSVVVARVQLIRAGLGPRELLVYLQPGPSFLAGALRRIAESTELVSLLPHSFGTAGLLLLPFALFSWCFLLLALLRIRRLFGTRWIPAAILASAAVLYLFALAERGLVGLRAESPLLPLLAPLAIAAAVDTFRRLRGLPTAASAPELA